MDCKRVRKTIFLFIDEELGDDERGSVEKHLSRCSNCDQTVRYMKRFLLVVRERCVRHVASTTLRRRILTSLPHRTTASSDGPGAMS